MEQKELSGIWEIKTEEETWGVVITLKTSEKLLWKPPSVETFYSVYKHIYKKSPNGLAL